MKKLITTCLYLFLASYSFGQIEAVKSVEPESETATPKGSNIINLYYGYSLYGAVLKTYESQTGYKSSTVGPVGLVFEHMMTDKIGLGAEFGYTKVNWSYAYNSTYFNSSSQIVPYVETYDWTYTLMRIQFRFNYHFAKSEKFDAYFLTSAGYRDAKYKFSYTSNDPNAPSSGSWTTPKSPFIFGIKPGLGFRYFFTKNVGVNLEITAGTPLMSGGLSFKF